MDETIERLKKKRDELYQKLRDVGDFRRGTISVIYRKCGKKNCACAQEGHPGHGPVYLWSATIKGKSYAKNLKLGPELEKYIEEIDNHKKFTALSEEIVVISERISDLRPVAEVNDEQELVALKKKIAESIHQEVQNEIERILGRYFTERTDAGVVDLEAFEINIRSSMHRVGSVLLEELINVDGDGYQGSSITDEEGHKYEFVDYRERELLTVLGTIKVKRAYYYDKEHHLGFCPKDRYLDIAGTSYSSGVRRMVSRVGAWRPFSLG